MNISQAFAEFPAEAAIIGRILAGYTDLELALMNCVKSAREDMDTVLKAMFRARGETQRVDIADAFGRQAYRALELGTQFEMGLGAIRHCMKIRNQYSHCIWWNDNTGQLAFANFEEIAKLNEVVKDLRGMSVRHVSVEHLQAQFAYFEYASNLLIWVLHEANKKTERPAFPNLNQPAARMPPPLYLS
ncbi:MAG: hypothetical protein NPIRA03_01160 [Nitrospirales bacterium]|nr:MAG: hypothetical protein NPIRA03_01160 [Nitrospirales bacterium]